MTKPILLLDVDGVLNIVSDELDEIEPVSLDFIVEDVLGINGGKPTTTFPLYPARLAREFLIWANQHCQIIWCTCWFDHANHIAKWAGIGPFPVLHDRTHFKDGLDWKVEEAKKVVCDNVLTIWVEDGHSKQAQDWIKTGPNIMLIATDPTIGVTEDVRKMIQKHI
jgi:hypothetical protein